MATEDPTCRGASDTVADDRGTESAVLGLLLEEHPAQLALSELKLVLNGETATFSDDDKVMRAIRELICAGLLHSADPFVVPSRAALRFHQLETG